MRVSTLSLQGPKGDQNVAMALADPDKFVLKPQREGGGKKEKEEDPRFQTDHLNKSLNVTPRPHYLLFVTTGNNYFGEDIVRVLQEMNGDKRRAAYILMDRIRPRTEQNILLRKGLPPKITSVNYEIGVFGAYLR